MRSSAGEHPLTGFFTSGAIIDYAPKDDPEMMQRPFFSLSKRIGSPFSHFSIDRGSERLSAGIIEGHLHQPARGSGIELRK